MCFYNDSSGWLAEVNEVSYGPGDSASRCLECGSQIALGEWRRHVYQRESECCVECGGGDDDGPCGDVEHEYGEIFTGDICEDCVKILRAIEAAEADEGCPLYARQPLYGELGETLVEHYGSDKYIERALEMYPELVTSRLLDYVTGRT
jgi:hypothetical protein